MSDHIESPAQQATVPTKNPDALQQDAPDDDNGETHGADHGRSVKENSEKAMAASHDQMMALCEENTPESLSEAHNIAHMLLERAELPLAFRTRAHMEAVRIGEKGRDIFGPGKTAQEKYAVEALLWQAREMLCRAERDMKELEDIRARKRAGTLKRKKGKKLLYGNINNESRESVSAILGSN
ncbi:hypothetical protein D6D15_05595 [Aureobasidium pullulans]|uniref:Uncharacterized protein n=1 Tax=Aureobasidium pullulans TaxID=5580 RepID=A0A4V6TAY1_AURPU|nr:hypothetical protein D6D15_05595 [Aureobasidium pullulans]